MEYIIEKMNESHIGGIALLERECFSVPWSENALREELSNPHARFFAAVHNGSVIGYIGAFCVAGEVAVSNVAVKGEYRLRGVASALLDKLTECVAAENAEFITLEVRASNENAIKLYAKSGFVRSGLRKGFYSKPVEDAVLMKKIL